MEEKTESCNTDNANNGCDSDGGRDMTLEEIGMTMFLKTWRKVFDGMLQEMKMARNDNPAFGGRDFQRQLSCAITACEDVIMRSGMCLKEVREMTHGKDCGSVYPNSYDPSNTVIDPLKDGMKM